MTPPLTTEQVTEIEDWHSDSSMSEEVSQLCREWRERGETIAQLERELDHKAFIAARDFGMRSLRSRVESRQKKKGLSND